MPARAGATMMAPAPEVGAGSRTVTFWQACCGTATCWITGVLLSTRPRSSCACAALVPARAITPDRTGIRREREEFMEVSVC